MTRKRHWTGTSLVNLESNEVHFMVHPVPGPAGLSRGCVAAHVKSKSNFPQHGYCIIIPSQIFGTNLLMRS